MADQYSRYIPGTYVKRVPGSENLAEQAIREWEQKRLEAFKLKKAKPRITRCITFSRKIGVGALEIADLLSPRLNNMRVVDREILEQIANSKKLGEKTINFFDERYPGLMQDLASLLFGEKSFTMADYMRHLTAAVFALADAEPTIFVGRGVHLILPRDRVLAVRFIASRQFRIKRIADILEVTEDMAAKELDRVDKEQRDFFKKNFNKKEASPYEFDLVINMDDIRDHEAAADIVEKAYKQKFEL